MNEISLSHLFKLALKRLWVLIISAILAASAAFCYFNFAATPSYRASGSLLSTNGAIITQTNSNGSTSSKVSNSDITSSLYLSYTIAELLNTSDIYKEVSKQIDGRYSYSQLMTMSSVSKRDEDTLFIDVSFSASNPEEAVELVNTFLSLAPEYINKYVPDSTTSITSRADKATLTYPRTVVNTALFGVLGAVLAYIVVFILDSLDHAIKSEEDYRSRFDLPLLGIIPNFENAGIQSPKGGYESVSK